MGIPLFSTVNEIITPNGWQLPPARSEKMLQLHTFITTLEPKSVSDRTVWLIDEVIQKSFSSRKVWNCIRDRKSEVRWAPLVWHKARVPKHAFSSWLFVLNRNPTFDRLMRWGCDVEDTCLLCGVSAETRDHLFFFCSYSAQIWKEVLSKLHFHNPPNSWDGILQWLFVASPNKDISLALLQAWQACIYEIWAERNRRSYLGVTVSASKTVQRIISVVKNRAQSLLLQNQDHQGLLNCWAPSHLLP